MNGGHNGPWIKVGVPGNLLERFRHTASDRLRPAPTRIRFEDPPSGGFMSAVGTVARTMPRTRTRTANKRRRYKRRRRGTLRRRIPRAFMPNSKVVRFKTVDCQSLDFAASTNVQTVAFSLMNLLDPLVTSGAQQPLGFDQISALYKRAVVIGVKIILRVHNQANVAVLTGITPMREAQGTTALGSAEYYMEANGTKSRLLSPDMDHQLIFHKVGTRRWFGVQSLKDEVALQCDLVTPSAPSRDAYFHVWAQPLNTGVLPTTGSTRVEFAVTLEHLVRVWDPIIPARSVV